MSQRELAYAKWLKARRMAGVHPDVIGVIYGDDWRLAKDAFERRSAALPILAIKPRDYRLGYFDFRVFAGVPAVIRDCSDERDWQYQGEWEKVLYFAGEIAQYASSVELTGQIDGAPVAADVLAFLEREWIREEKYFRWPLWWPNGLRNG
jgi:hypothetical protein